MSLFLSWVSSLNVLCLTVVGMDPSHTAMAAESANWQLAGWSAEETGGIPHIPSQAQAPTCRAKSKAWDQLQHSSDKASPVKQAGLHAHRGKDGVGTFLRLV